MEISSQRQSILRSCRTLWLKRLVNIVQDVGMLPIAVNAMQQGVGEFFDGICKVAQGIPVEEESFMTASRILLVNEDDLEVGIRLDNVGNRIQESAGRYLMEVRRRFMTLFNTLDVTAHVNPVDTEGIAKGLKMMLAELGDSSVDEKMLIIERLEKRLINGIPNVYREIDTLLQNSGIPAANVVLTNVASTTVKAKRSPWKNDYVQELFGDKALDEKVDEAAAMSLIDGGFILPDMEGPAAFSFAEETSMNPFNTFADSAPAKKTPKIETPKKSQTFEKFSFANATGNPKNAPKEEAPPAKKQPKRAANFEKNNALTVENQNIPQNTPNLPPETPQIIPQQTAFQQKAPDHLSAPIMPPLENLPPQNLGQQVAQQLAAQATAQQATAPAVPVAPQVAPTTVVEFARPQVKKAVPNTGNPLADLWNYLRREDVFSPAPDVLKLVRERIIKRMNYLHEGMDFDDDAASTSQIQATSDIYNLHQLFPDLFVPAGTQNDSEVEMPAGLDSRALGLQAGSPEAASLDTMDLIVSTLMRTTEIPEPFKSFLLLIHPQLALFALSDSTIFTSPTHPIHVCTKTLGALMLGLPPETPQNHPAFDGLFEAVRKPLKKLQKPVTAKVLENTISKIQETLLSRMIVREEELSVVTNDYLSLLRLLEKRENVLNNIAESISKHLMPKIPDVLRDFFEGPWQQRMQKMWLEKDSDKAKWHEEFRLLPNLQKTFEPVATLEERDEMAKQIPPILQEMRQIMIECGLNEMQQKVILSTCVMLQNAALKGRDGLSDYKTQGNLPEMRLRAELRMRRVHSGDKRLNTLYYTGKNNTKVPLPQNFVPGVWVEFHVDRDTPCLARLCDVAELKFWFFLANPDTHQFWALQPDVLQHQFAEGRAKIITPPSPFEAAAAQVLKENS